MRTANRPPAPPRTTRRTEGGGRRTDRLPFAGLRSGRRPPSGPQLRVAVPGSPRLFWTLLVVISALCAIGLVFVLSASMVAAEHTKPTAWYWFLRQAFFLGLGTAAAFVAVRVDYRRWVRLGPLVLLGSMALLTLVLLPTPLSREVNGANRWLGPESFTFQPSELAKLGMVLWLAGLLERRRHQMDDWTVTVAPAMAVLAVVAALIVFEPDLGTTSLIAAVTVTMLIVAGARLDRIAAIGLPLVAIGLAFSMRGYHRARLLAFLDPWAYAYGAGWQTLQSQVGLASGGLLGVGLGNSKTKWGFLPDAHTDFIFAIIGEELGLVGCLVVLGLVGAFIVTGLNVARRAPDLSGTLVAAGITSWIGLQSLINIGVAVGVLPNKGITLPFVSYGGTSLVMTLFAAGILLNIARQPGAVAPARARRR